MKNITKIIVFVFCVLYQWSMQAQKVQGVVVDYIPASTQNYIGSPSICILPNGEYVASHDYFGPGSTENQRGLTSIFKSKDKGKSWTKISEIKGQFWSNLFVYKDILYIMGTWKTQGDFIIRRSLDRGVTWSEPTDSKNGLLLEGGYSTAAMPMAIHNGRLWRSLEIEKPGSTLWGRQYNAMVISAAVSSDLLDASSWTSTNSLPYDSTYLDGKFGGWLEGNVVVTPEGNLVDILRVVPSGNGQREMAAIVKISNDGLRATFDSSIGFIDFEGGAKKFSIRYDEKSKRYWTLANKVKKEFSNLQAGSVRNTLVIMSSQDLKIWTAHKILLSHPDVERHGFQYVDWQFDGQDIIFISRTAYDDKFGGAHNFHDANYLTFHRIKNFRKSIRSCINDHYRVS